MLSTNKNDFYRIGRVKISITNEDKAVQSIKDLVRNKAKGYLCISNMRTVAIANKDDKYQEVMENSLMNTPDGTPLVWCGHWWGLKKVGRACGPHIFPRVIKEGGDQLKHFFLGDTDETLSKLTQKVKSEYNAIVAGTYSPPFCPIEEYDINYIAKLINDSGANIVWTSLRAPKQDFLNAKITPHLNDGIIMIGVGAAFRIELGIMPQPDGFLQKIGLVGLRLKRKGDPWWKNLWWYTEHIFALAKYFVTIKLRRLRGISPWHIK